MQLYFLKSTLNKSQFEGTVFSLEKKSFVRKARIVHTRSRASLPSTLKYEGMPVFRGAWGISVPRGKVEEAALSENSKPPRCAT